MQFDDVITILGTSGFIGSDPLAAARRQPLETVEARVGRCSETSPLVLDEGFLGSILRDLPVLFAARAGAGA